MKHSRLVSQGSLNRMLREADDAWKRYDFPAAIETVKRASRLDPSNARLLLSLGRMYGLHFDYATAEKCFEQAVRVAIQKSETLTIAGQYSYDFGNYSMAENYLRRALKEKNLPTILVKLAEVFERLRRSEEATDLVQQALKIDPACASALLSSARLNRQAKQLETAETLLRNFPSNADPALRASAAYQLGDILDRQGRYSEAMAAFFEAKAMLKPLAAQPIAELKVMRARINHLIANISSDKLKQWTAIANLFQPIHKIVLLGGHPRSGTTLLEQVLDSHPDIISAEETENFFNYAYGPLLRGHSDNTAMFEALTATTFSALQQARKNYYYAMESSLGKPLNERLLIDKNPSYTFLIPAFIRIFPETKFLIALRDPRDVVLSCFMQNLPLNQVGAAYLTLESTAEEYTALMGVWQTIVPLMSSPFLEIRYEDMVENLESVARKTLDFLGISWNTQVLGFDEHARKRTVRSPTYADVTQPVYKRAVGRWQHYQKYLEPCLTKLKPFIKAFGYE
ncbi:MAG TPA: sulfotransferase [Verrucomicrobiae bacterium]|nr:sulfotransferase [Verrucomicrobiae bacterium]